MLGGFRECLRCQKRLKLNFTVDECKPLPTLPASSAVMYTPCCVMGSVWYVWHASPTVGQGLTLVHFSAQLERCLWDRGCGARRGRLTRIEGVLDGVEGVQGVSACQTRLKLSCEVNKCKPLPWVCTRTALSPSTRVLRQYTISAEI